MNPKHIQQRAIKGGFWIFSLRTVGQLFNFIRLIVLARLLSPNDFGLMGIALLSMMTLETFSETGFKTALIQNKKNIKNYLNSAWTVLILRGVILFAILYLIAPHAAVFFNAPAAKPIIQIIALSILLHAFTNIGVVYFQKELEFKKQFKYEFSGIFADFIVAISAALIFRNVWALVLGFVAGNAASLIMSYKLHDYRPKLDFNLSKAKELWGFGKWILGSSILIFLFMQGDDIFVGKVLGVAALGFYQMAYKISNLPVTEITHVISKITFPAYSKLQQNARKLKVAYLKVLQITAFLSFPVAGAIFFLAEDFTLIFLTQKWMPIVPVIKVLILAGLCSSIGATAGPLFQSIGKPKISTKWQFIRLFVLIALIYPLSSKFGITGIAIAVLASILVSTVAFSFMAIKVTKCTVRKFVKRIFFPFLGAFIMVSLLWMLKGLVAAATVPNFLLLAFCGAVSYVFAIYLCGLVFRYDIFSLLKDCIKSFDLFDKQQAKYPFLPN